MVAAKEKKKQKQSSSAAPSTSSAGSSSKPAKQAVKLKLSLNTDVGVVTTPAPQPPSQAEAKTKKERKNKAPSGGVESASDDDEPEVAIEEQFILRLPPGEICDQLRDMVRRREVPEDVGFSFRAQPDNRRGHFIFGGQRYETKLVDLPSIIEAQKTLDHKQLCKVADISQMLVVEGVAREDGTSSSEANHMGRNNPDQYLWPDGLTPPLKYVRKRRFRKRLSKRAIEVVEKEVERLLQDDAQAEKVEYDVHDVNDAEDSEDDIYPTAGDVSQMDMDAEDADDVVDDAESDQEMAAEIDRVFDEIKDEDEEDDDEDEDEESDEEDDEDEEDEMDATTREFLAAQVMLHGEIAELEASIQKQETHLNEAVNPIVKKRFEITVEGLTAKVNTKRSELSALQTNYKGNRNVTG